MSKQTRKDYVECEKCNSLMRGDPGIDFCPQCMEWRYFLPTKRKRGHVI